MANITLREPPAALRDGSTTNPHQKLMASATPPKKRHRAGGDSLREQVLKFPFPMFVLPKSPHEQHRMAYYAYEADVRGALASEDLTVECDFDVAEATWVRTIDHELPVKSLPISSMSDSIIIGGGGSFESCLVGLPGPPIPIPKDDGQMPPQLRVLFAEETVTLASLLDKEFFVGMILSAGSGTFGPKLYATAMAWVWAMLKLDFDPEGTPVAEDKTKHFQEQDRFSDKQKKLTDKICREIIRKEFGDAGVAIYDETHSSVAALYASGLPGIDA